MMAKTKKPWGGESRHCLRCGKVGPRVLFGFGWIHDRCRTAEEKREVRAAVAAEAKRRKAMASAKP